MPATYTIDGSPKNDVRLFISDIGGQDGNSFIFQDEEIERFIALSSDGNLSLAAAKALRVLASNEALVSKRIKFLELETDGAVIAKQLLAAAAEYEKQAELEEEPEIIELGVDQFSRRYLRRGWVT